MFRRKMRSMAVVMACVTGLALAGLALRARGAVAPTAAQASATSACSNAALNGLYRYTFSGYGFAGQAPVHVTAPGAVFAAVGLVAFNGQGSGTGADTMSLGGLIRDRQYVASYAIKGDCTGTMALNFCPPGDCTGPANIVAAPDGSEVLFINTIPGTTVLGQFRKQPQ